MFKKIFFFSILFLSYFGFSQLKEYPLKRISTSEGLSQSSVIAIQQDSFGQVWFGTRDGLNKYDGNTFTIYRNTDDKNSISNNDILSITEDKKGFLWLGTYNGLNKFDPKTNTFVNYFHKKENTSLSNNTIWCIKEMKNGEIWIGTSDGLSIFNRNTNQFTNIYHNASNEKSLSGNHILSIIETDTSEIFIGTNNGLSKLVSRNKLHFEFLNYKAIKFPVQDILQKDNNLLIATNGDGVLNLNTKNGSTSYFIEKENIHKNVRKLCFDNQNNLWIGTYDGLFIYDTTNTIINLKNKINDFKSLSKNSVKSLFKDKKGSIWIGTYYGGINLWDNSNINFKNLTTNRSKNSLSYNVVSSIENYKNKLLFIGTEGKGLNILDRINNSISYINNDNYKALSDENIKSLLVDNNRLWIGTLNSGINVFDIKKNLFRNSSIPFELKKYLKNTGVYSIKKNQNNIWIGTFGKGLICFNDINKSFKIYTKSTKDLNTITDDLIRTIAIDSQENIWVGSQKGLSKIAPSGNISRYFYNSEIESGEDITSIFEDANQTIWVGSKAKGLFKFNGKSFIKTPLKTQKETVTSIHSILEDNDNNLWISTNQGIVKHNLKSKKTIIYNVKDGLVSNEFNDNASIKINSSLFYFGGPNGLTSFNTKFFTVNNYSPQVLITDFKIKNKPLEINSTLGILNQTIEYTNSLNLSHKQGNFTLHFAIPNYINQKNNAYQYRLKGLEKDWIYTTKNTASYTIQNPGEFIFEVKGANNNGLWNNTPTSLKIIVEPAPWRSWWAFTIYGLAIIIALYLLFKIQKAKSSLKHKLDLEYIENEKIEEANKAKLEFFTNISHEFRTPLTLILGPLQQILKEYKGSSKVYKKLLVVDNNANHLLQLINRLMDFRKLEKNLFKLETAEGNIVKFLKEIYLSFSEYAKDGEYEYNFHTTNDKILVYYDRYKLERVFYNLISNAFRYTPKNGVINIRIRQEEYKILIAVEDSGVGITNENKDKIFDRFFELSTNNNPEKTYNKGTGIGLSIAKNIVKLHKGKIIVEDNNISSGSIFTVELPLGKEHLTKDEIINDFKFSDDISQYVNQLSESVVLIEDDFKDNIIDNSKSTILLVEDNKPLRKFMKSLLKEKYNILEAENGKAALKSAIRNQPDLIVSDVVMPVMVGTELCAEIKNNIKTSHIPIILLTSRTSLIYKLDGLNNGADDYISKPFNVKEFKVRVKNIISSNNRTKEKFSGVNSILSNEVIISSLDEKLHKKALKIVENNISNLDFDIPYFCSELGVSRTMLFTKIKAWTNFTPNEFIHNIRMNYATQLLEQGKINISEVSYKVGFKSPKYFSKCFLKKYGKTPSQYQKKFSEL
ncbi:two-component regulator propeller domain-containing protein [uncultured Polaribacter sp.]|uniref:hybrid sensor histidine kinase/response regulator transcription factor n=1 Tax=uncultured Polaribacter sp. TaxID=174711 RepID=UPI00259AFE4F|nr:two-component regulator propeller domain-containing protein [uncultured Polaribacter sp.]